MFVFDRHERHLEIKSLERLVQNLQCYLIMLQPTKTGIVSLSSQLKHLAVLLSGVYLLSKKLENLTISPDAFDSMSVNKLRAMLSFCLLILEELCCSSFVESLLIRLTELPPGGYDEISLSSQPFAGDSDPLEQPALALEFPLVSVLSPDIKKKGNKKSVREVLEEKIRGDVMCLRVEALASISTLMHCLFSSTLSSGNIKRSLSRLFLSLI